MKGIVLTLMAVTLLACSETENDVKSLIDDLPISMNLGHVLVLESDEHRLYAGTLDNGIFVSQDDGYTWRATSFKGTCESITVDGNTVYAGVGETGAIRSDDAGITWKPINNGLPFIDADDGTRYYTRVYQIFVTQDKIIAGVNDLSVKVLVSANRGESWYEEDWFGDVDTVESMTALDNYVWVSTAWNDRKFWSSDYGETWRAADMDESVIDPSDQRANDWAVLNNRLYIAMLGGVARWNEKAHTWEYLMDGLPVHRTVVPIASSDPRGSPWISSSAVHGGLLFVGIGANLSREGGVYIFDTKAKTWSSAGLKGVPITDLLSYKSSLYAGTRNGIYRAEVSRQPHGGVVATWERMIL